jgi:hypothetical protein
MQRRPRTLALGVWLAARGGLATIGFVLAAAGAIGAAVVGVALHGMDEGGAQAADALPVVASSAIAWSAGVMLAFGGALRALRRDREDGILGLALARGATARQYVGGRVAGLAVVIVAAVGGATLVASLVALFVGGGASRPVRLSAGAMAYALAFAATVAPVAMATLGGRSRAGGYLAFLAVLALPELLAGWTRNLLPAGWHELTSIPAALAAVRSGVAEPSANGAQLGRALAALAAVVAIAVASMTLRIRRSGESGTP